jgi:hypothetical protein
MEHPRRGSPRCAMARVHCRQSVANCAKRLTLLARPDGGSVLARALPQSRRSLRRRASQRHTRGHDLSSCTGPRRRQRHRRSSVRRVAWTLCKSGGDGSERDARCGGHQPVPGTTATPNIARTLPAARHPGDRAGSPRRLSRDSLVRLTFAFQPRPLMIAPDTWARRLHLRVGRADHVSRRRRDRPRWPGPSPRPRSGAIGDTPVTTPDPSDQLTSRSRRLGRGRYLRPEPAQRPCAGAQADRFTPAARIPASATI